MSKIHESDKPIRFRKPLGILSNPKIFNTYDAFLIQTLRSYCFKDPVCWPTIETLMEDTLLSRSSVKRALTKLENHGFITRKKGSVDGDVRRTKYYLNMEKICGESEEESTEYRVPSEPYLGSSGDPKNDNRVQCGPYLGSSGDPIKGSVGTLNDPLHYSSKENTKEKFKSLFFKAADVPAEKKKKLIFLMEFFEEEVARQRAGKEVSEDWILAGQRWLVEMAPVLETKGQRPHHEAEIQELVRRFLGSDQKYFEKQLAYAKSGGYRLPIEHISKQQQTKNESESYIEPAFPVYRCGQK